MVGAGTGGTTAPATGGGGMMIGMGGAAAAGGTGMAGMTGNLGGAPGAAGGASNPPGDVAWEAWPTVPAVSADVCQVTLFHGGDALSPPVPPDPEIREFNPATGIMKRQFGAFGNQPAALSYAVFTPQGYAVGGCVVTVDPYGCTEWVRDAHGNVTTWDTPSSYTDQNFMLSLLDASRFGTKAHGSVQASYTLTYDAAGALASVRNTDPSLTFTEDAQHRCSDVLWKVEDTTSAAAGSSEREHWTWEGNRLVSRVTTNGAAPNEVRSVVTFSYDANGDLASTVVDGYPSLAQAGTGRAPVDGIADYVVRTVALPDGTRWLEELDFHYYQLDAKVVRAGTVTPVARRRWNYSAGCRGVEPARRTSTACQFEPVQNQLDVRWHDPYTTPNRRR